MDSRASALCEIMEFFVAPMRGNRPDKQGSGPNQKAHQEVAAVFDLAAPLPSRYGTNINLILNKRHFQQALMVSGYRSINPFSALRHLC